MSIKGETRLPLPQAQEEFMSIARKVNDRHNLKKLIEWINWTWREECADEESPDEILKSIAMDIRVNLPLDAVAPSERIKKPVTGPNADCDPNLTRHVDSFLYDHEMVDELVARGTIAAHYCSECGSQKTKPLTFISHSASRSQISYMFNVLLPPIDNKILLDVGSRIGAVLYGAYLHTKASKIYGVEMNGELCRIQRELVMKYGFQDRIEVIESNIYDKPDLVSSADVIVLNNVFEFFMEPDQQIEMWKFIRSNAKECTLLVTVPSLETVLESLPDCGISLSDWVQELDMYIQDAPGMPSEDPENAMIHLYRVKKALP